MNVVRGLALIAVALGFFAALLPAIQPVNPGPSQVGGVIFLLALISPLILIGLREVGRKPPRIKP